METSQVRNTDTLTVVANYCEIGEVTRAEPRVFLDTEQSLDNIEVRGLDLQLLPIATVIRAPISVDEVLAFGALTKNLLQLCFGDAFPKQLTEAGKYVEVG